jgi:hypothetical protein
VSVTGQFENQLRPVFDWTNSKTSPTDIILLTTCNYCMVQYKIKRKEKEKKSTPKAVAREAGHEYRMKSRLAFQAREGAAGGVVGIGGTNIASSIIILLLFLVFTVIIVIGIGILGCACTRIRHVNGYSRWEEVG